MRDRELWKLLEKGGVIYTKNSKDWIADGCNNFNYRWEEVLEIRRKLDCLLKYLDLEYTDTPRVTKKEEC